MLPERALSLAHESGYTAADLYAPKALIVHAALPGTLGQVVAICDGLDEAEDLMLLYEWADEEGALRGDYNIAWPCRLAYHAQAA